MSDPRRFDSLERTVRDTRRAQEDSASTVLSRLGTHKHAAADIISGLLDFARLPIGRTSTTVPTGDHDHNRDVIGETRYAFTTSSVSAPSTAFVGVPLGFSLTAGGKYIYKATLFYSATAAADIRIAMTGPAGFTGRMAFRGRDTVSTTGSIATTQHGVGLVGDQPALGGIGTLSVLMAEVVALFDGVGANGSVGLFIDQVVTDGANPTSVFSGSFAEITRVS